eukprot:13585244-Alexandrium_andersonii.AAC.1
MASMGATDRDATTAQLGVQPVRIEAGKTSHCRRPRYYWIDAPIDGAWRGQVAEADSVLHVTPPGAPGPASRLSLIHI